MILFRKHKSFLAILCWAVLCASSLAFAEDCNPPAPNPTGPVPVQSGVSCCGTILCDPVIAGCGEFCACISDKETVKTIKHISDAFELHKKWMVEIFFKDDRKGSQCVRDTVPGVLAAMQIMTSQLTAAALDQALIIGSFLDAKHQLETQRLFQQLTARAHKDYHPSEGLCEVGTEIRSISPSIRKSDLAHTTFANRMVARQLLSGDVLSIEGENSDFLSRLQLFVKKFCNPNDDGNGLEYLCKNSKREKERFNKDVDFTQTIDIPLTLEIDFTQDGAQKTDDEENIFALSANLYAHNPLPTINKADLVNDKDQLKGAALYLMDLRSIAAKRSVAQNSFAAIAAQKAEGTKESRPFLYAALKEMGGKGFPDEEIEKYLGKKPSYYAQMEMLTKKLYQYPVFYTETYDKPANVLRKEVAMQAIELMQKRDIFRALLRSEAIFSVMLETALADKQKEIKDETDRLNQEGTVKKK